MGSLILGFNCTFSDRLRQLLLMGDRDGRTPLHFAIISNNGRMVRQVLSLCPETINSYDRRGVTPFVQAILAGSDEVRELIFSLI